MSASSGSTLWRAVRQRLKPPRTLKVTRTGRTYLLVTVGVGLGALNTGNNLLYLVLGVLLSMIVVSGVLSERSLKWLAVERIGTESAYASEPVAYRFALERLKGMGFAYTVKEAGGALEGQGSLAVLEMGARAVLRADVTPERRGPLALEGIAVTTTYPLGLFAKTRVFDLPGTLLVFPKRTYVCDRGGIAESGPAGERGNPLRSDGTGDLLGLKELGPGEDSRRVHWLKSAAAGKLLKVEREREERRTYLLEVDPAAPLPLLDRRCEEAAASAHRLIAEGHEVGLRAGETQLRPAAGPAQERRILIALARLGHDGYSEGGTSSLPDDDEVAA